MRTASQEKQSFVGAAQASIRRAPSIKHQPRSKRFYFDVGLGSVCLSGKDTGGACCLLEVSLAPGMAVPRHTHTREDEVYFVLAGELEVTVEEKIFVLRPGDTLLAPRDIPHALRNCGNITNHYLLIFSPSGFEEFIMATAVPAPDNAVAPTEPPTIAVRNVHELASDYGILFGWSMARCRMLLLATLLLVLLQQAMATEDDQSAVRSETLLRNSSSWDDEPYKSYSSGQPELSVLKITLQPNTELECHSHPIPSAAYVVAGELTVERKKDGKKQILSPARRFPGNEPVVLVVFYAGRPGIPVTQKPKDAWPVVALLKDPIGGLAIVEIDKPSAW